MPSMTPGGYCCPECDTEQCNCRCGESICLVGVFIFIAACLFWLLGAALGWNSYRPDADDSFHQFNIWWFQLSFVLVVLGIVYAIIFRQGKAFSREPQDGVVGAEKDTGDEPESAPTPYIMLSAEP
eukprot:TRINITY_DN935_c0_g1_i4.p1 TRINITY_DN935_c0_g1~~TRINITY_DN935_c0_g1_i4.p1  ORF type:complete len:126 (-),score=22.43 TRINITY_DN935_c0_g1_i4:107-484(-)